MLRGVWSRAGRQVGVAGEQATRPRQIFAREALYLVRLLDLFDGGEIAPAPEAVEDDVVQLCQDDRGNLDRIERSK